MDPILNTTEQDSLMPKLVEGEVGSRVHQASEKIESLNLLNPATPLSGKSLVFKAEELNSGVSGREELASIPFFQYVDAADAQRIRAILTNETSQVERVTSLIGQGNWSGVINFFMENPDHNRYVLFAAHAQMPEKVTALDVMTSVMFYDAVSVLSPGETWEIQHLEHSSLSENAQYQLCISNLIPDEIPEQFGFRGRSPVFNPTSRLNDKLIVPTAQAFSQKGETIFPVLGLSKREDMLQRLSENKHDYAIFPFQTSALIHGCRTRVKIGRQFRGALMAYHHDDFHRAKRMKAGLHYPALVEVARNGLKKILEELPEYSEKSLQKDSMGGSWIEQVNKDDCYRWIVDFMIDLIIDAEFTSFDADPHKDPSSYCETLFQEMIKKTFDTIRSETFIDRDGKEGVRGVGGYIRIGTNKTLEAEWTDKLMAALKEKDLGSAILSRIVPPSS